MKNLEYAEQYLKDSNKEVARVLGITYYHDFMEMQKDPENVGAEFYLATIENIFAVLKNHGIDCRAAYADFYKKEV